MIKTKAAMPAYWYVGLDNIVWIDFSSLATLGKYFSRSYSSVLASGLVFFFVWLFKALIYSCFLLDSSAFLFFYSSTILAFSNSWFGYSFLYSSNFDLDSVNFFSVSSFFFRNSLLLSFICLIWYSFSFMILAFYFLSLDTVNWISSCFLVKFFSFITSASQLLLNFSYYFFFSLSPSTSLLSK